MTRMRWSIGSAAAAALAAAVLTAGSATVHVQAQAPVTSPASAQRKEVFDRYCVSCHTEAQKTRGAVPVALDMLDIGNVGAHAELWERVVLKVRAGVMPPAGMPRPDRATLDGLVGWLETQLDLAAAARPNPGRTEPLHRLNRTEYRNAIRDLLGLDLDVAPLLPADDSSYGFDNIAGVLKLSPTLMERYLTAALKVSRLAVGSAGPTGSIDYFRVADDLSQDRHVDGLPLGTRGGMRVSYVFPMDGEYEFRPRLARDLNEQVPLYPDDQLLEVSVDGVRVGVFTLNGVARGGTPPASPPPATSPSEPGAAPGAPQRPAISQIATGVRLSAKEREARNRADETWNLRVPVKAGQRDVVVTFINPTVALDETARLPFLRPYPSGVNIPETRLGAHLRSLEIEGPINPAGPGTSPAREQLFVCRPPAVAELTCARRIFTTLATRAYRRPARAEDLEPLLAFYREGREGGTFESGIERGLRRLLVSPEFLFRVEREPAGAAPGTPYRISDLELASRLSFFLWSSIPDDELIALASRQQLSRPAVLERQVRRMLASPKAAAFVRNFAGQWLFLRNLDASAPVQSVFPDFDDALRQGFRRETELFVESIVREDRSAFDLLRADYTYVNDRLAQHYGLPGIRGSHFRRVTLPPDNPRRGLLGHGSILTVTSYPDRTSPVVRGKWILENLLGTPAPPPLPNVPPLRATNTNGLVLSMRQRMETHRANPVCASCHTMMDPLGLSLENFDAVGKWRVLGESSARIDATGRLPDGTPFEGPAGLRDALLRSDRFVATLTEKMLTYALGRGLEYYDAPSVRAILRQAAPREHRMSALVTGIVTSAPFRMRRAGDAGTVARAQ